jgi:cell division inhibitor SulA
LQWAVQEILTPAYRQLVLEAPDELERTAGLSLVHLIWLELSEQAEMGPVIAEPDRLMKSLNDRAGLIARHLQLLSAKSEMAQLLTRIRAIRHFAEQGRVPWGPRILPEPSAAPNLTRAPSPVDVVPTAPPPASPPD